MKSIRHVESQAAQWCRPHEKEHSVDAKQMLSMLGGVALRPSFEQLLTAFASASPKDAMQKLNPHLDCDAVQFSIACVLFLVTRVNQICRCLQACREVKVSTDKLVSQLETVQKVDSEANDMDTLTSTSGLAKALRIKIDILVQQLSAARTIGASVSTDSRNFAVDRRFLVFEFLTG